MRCTEGVHRRTHRFHRGSSHSALSPAEMLLESYTVAGAVIAIVGLAGTALLILFNHGKDFVMRQHIIFAQWCIVMCLACAAYLAANDVAIAGTACKFWSIAFHYLILATFSWAFCDALCFYTTYIQSLCGFEPTVRHLFAIGLVVPTIPVLITGAHNEDHYVDSNGIACWLVDDDESLAFVIPAAILGALTLWLYLKTLLVASNDFAGAARASTCAWMFQTVGWICAHFALDESSRDHASHSKVLQGVQFAMFVLQVMAALIAVAANDELASLVSNAVLRQLPWRKSSQVFRTRTSMARVATKLSIKGFLGQMNIAGGRSSVALPKEYMPMEGTDKTATLRHQDGKRQSLAEYNNQTGELTLIVENGEDGAEGDNVRDRRRSNRPSTTKFSLEEVGEDVTSATDTVIDMHGKEEELVVCDAAPMQDLQLASTDVSDAAVVTDMASGTDTDDCADGGGGGGIKPKRPTIWRRTLSQRHITKKPKGTIPSQFRQQEPEAAAGDDTLANENDFPDEEHVNLSYASTAVASDFGDSDSEGDGNDLSFRYGV
eukprot:m.310875 g.310875  ORF g.310875 m.310875 type:complete len:548 (-) comp26117_c0_seq1:176-1819(-)